MKEQDVILNLTLDMFRVRKFTNTVPGVLSVLIAKELGMSFVVCENWSKRIEEGGYNVTYDLSPRFSKLSPYSDYKGLVPYISHPSRVGIRMHIGNWPLQSQGCLLIGTYASDRGVLDSAKAYKKFMSAIMRHNFPNTRLNVYDYYE